MNIYCTHLNKVIEVYENNIIFINLIICAINRRRLVCSLDRPMSPHHFAQEKMADVIFIIKHHFYLISFITSINATNVY